MAHHFEIYRDKSDEYRVRFKYNSEVMFSTELEDMLRCC